MTKVEEIFTAWRISFNPSHAQAALAAKRIELCNSCPFKRSVKINDSEYLMRCSKCGCGIAGKIYTPKTYLDEGGSCPESLWKEVEEEWLNLG